MCIRRLMLNLIALWIASSCTGQVLPDTHYLYTEIRKLIRFETDIERKKTPGILIGILEPGQTYALIMGQKELSSPAKPGYHDLHELGSVSKLFTAAIVSRLVQDGVLGWHHPVSQYLPEICTSKPLDAMTIADLIAHQSGLPKFPPFIGRYEDETSDLYANYPKSEICGFLSGLRSDQLQAPRYSHLNYAVVEILLENILKQPFHALADSLLFKPLGMTSTTFLPVDTLAPGYDLGAYPAAPMRFSSFAAAQGAKSTLRDMMRFLLWVLTETQFPSMPSGVSKEMAIREYDSNLGKEIGFTNGWFMIHPKRKRDVLLHSGKSNGHHASVSYCPQTKTGVVVLSNSVTGTGNLGYLILRMINHNWKRK